MSVSIPGYLVPDDRDTLLRFFAVFSRFEYALKADGLFVPTDPKARPDWDRLATVLQNRFDKGRTDELREAADYILGDPPQRQRLNAVGTAIVFVSPPPEGGTELMRLVHHIRDMRNNLFHGGKAKPNSLADVGRNAKLLRCGLVVLDECLRLCETERPSFVEAYTDEHGEAS